MREFFVIFYSIPCIAVSYIFRGGCSCSCCSCSSFCDDICPGGRTGSTPSRATNEAMVVIGFAIASENNGGTPVRSVSSSSSDGCCCCLCEYIFIFIYTISILPVSIFNTILYYIGLVAVSVIVCIFFLFYIFPLLIAYLFEKCLCCKPPETVNNQEENKLTYSYYCKRNVAPLVLTFIIIILILLSIPTYFILKNLSKIKAYF